MRFIFTLFVVGIGTAWTQQSAGMEQDSKSEAADKLAVAIAGKVLDSKGQAVVNATVIVCDFKTGIPIDRGTGKPFTDVPQTRDATNVVWTSTSIDGSFQFEGIPKGEYRLTAQSWKENEAIDSIREVNGKSVTIRGVADRVVVPSKEALAIEMRPLGTGTLIYGRGSGNDDWYLVVSTRPPSGDPVLMFAGWQGPFLQNAIGFHRMPKGQSIVHGLPAGEVHYAVFASDSRPGFGAGTVRFSSEGGQTVTANDDIVAGWSDARHTPPKRLEPLVELLKKTHADGKTSEFWLTVVKGTKHEGQADLMQVFRKKGLEHAIAELGPLDRKITIDDQMTATFGDILAAEAYLRLGQMNQRPAKKK